VFKSQKFVWFILLATVFSSAFFILYQWFFTKIEIENLDNLTITQNLKLQQFTSSRQKHAPIKVKGLYLTAYSAGSPAKIGEIIKLINDTELNAVVIDVKDYSGYVLYDSHLSFVIKNQLKDARIKDLRALLSQLRRQNIYTIARVSVFQDPLLAEKKPQWAIQSKQLLGSTSTSKLWRDKKGLAWVDPNKKEVWDYALSIAKEAANAGFDEINFDYIRFPTDGPMGDIVYTQGTSTRYAVINKFFAYAAQNLKDLPVYISADLFGLTTEKGGEDDMMIGQRLSDAVKHFDYVCPMVYPSHYPQNYLNFVNPADHPYEVVYNAMKSGVAQAQGQKAKLRAWIQAFNMGAIYDGEKIRAQIQATDDAKADGWILWNAANRYSVGGLLSE